jgi:hypothetical protein
MNNFKDKNMNLNWLSWSNPVTFWWIFLVAVSIINITAWIGTRKYVLNGKTKIEDFNSRLMIWLSAGYVFGCAFRSILPKADVQRICLFDTWFSSVFLGRSVATIAELCFIAQWALVLHFFSTKTDLKFPKLASKIIVPIIVVAEMFSWYAVISTNYLGNTIEESLWTVTYTIIIISLLLLRPQFKGAVKYFISMLILGSLLYVAFMSTVDVPMYFTRFRADLAAGKVFFGFFEGIRDLNTRWVVTYDINDWRTEIPWMSLYFSVAVWISIVFCYLPLIGKNNKEK